MATPASAVHHLTPEVLSDAHQLRDLLIGAAAALLHPHRREAVIGGRFNVLEAQACAERVLEQLEALAQLQIEAERAERAHRAESARVQTALPSGGLR